MAFPNVTQVRRETDEEFRASWQFSQEESSRAMGIPPPRPFGLPDVPGADSASSALVGPFAGFATLPSVGDAPSLTPDLDALFGGPMHGPLDVPAPSYYMDDLPGLYDGYNFDPSLSTTPDAANEQPTVTSAASDSAQEATVVAGNDNINGTAFPTLTGSSEVFEEAGVQLGGPVASQGSGDGVDMEFVNDVLSWDLSATEKHLAPRAHEKATRNEPAPETFQPAVLPAGMPGLELQYTQAAHSDQAGGFKGYGSNVVLSYSQDIDFSQLDTESCSTLMSDLDNYGVGPFYGDDRHPPHIPAQADPTGQQQAQQPPQVSGQAAQTGQHTAPPQAPLQPQQSGTADPTVPANRRGQIPGYAQACRSHKLTCGEHEQCIPGQCRLRMEFPLKWAADHDKMVKVWFNGQVGVGPRISVRKLFAFKHENRQRR